MLFLVVPLLALTWAGMVHAASGVTPQGLPLAFEPVQDAAPGQPDFISRTAGQRVWLKRGEAAFPIGDRTPQLVRMRLVGTRNGSGGEGLERRAGFVNVFRGSDPSAWRTHIPTYGRVRYAEVLEHIDWEFYGTPDQLEHDFVVRPGGDPKNIALRFEGAESVTIDARGGVQVATATGVMRLRPPVVYQGERAAPKSIDSRYAIDAAGNVGFELGEYDASRTLVIDPVIEYSTYYGGTSEEVGWDIAVDGDGNAYVAGTTNSSNMPTTTGAYDEMGRVGGFSDPGDGFVMKLAPDGSSLVWATYLSGRGLDRLFGIAIDANNDVYVVGDTDSTDDLGTGGVDESYPQVSAAQAGFGGVADLVVTKIDASGGSLDFSTYLGGNDADRANSEQGVPGIAVSSTGTVYLSVVTQSTDFHTLYSCTETSPGPYMVRLNAAGSSFDACVGLGGDDFVFARDIALDSSGRAVIVGFTADPNLNTTSGTFSTAPLMGEDAFIIRINSAATAVDAGTYFGGTSDDFANAVAIGGDGGIYITGRSSGGGYPITSGSPPSGDAVATKIDSALSTVTWSLVVGYNEGLGIAVDSLHRATVVGTDNQDAGFTLLTATGTIDHETFWGGLLFDTANSVALDIYGHAYVTGETRSTGFPGDTVLNPSPFQATRSGNIDAWVVKHRRNFPVFLPGLTWGLVPLVLAMAWFGTRSMRRGTSLVTR